MVTNLYNRLTTSFIYNMPRTHCTYLYSFGTHQCDEKLGGGSLWPTGASPSVPQLKTVNKVRKRGETSVNFTKRNGPTVVVPASSSPKGTPV